MLLSGFNEVVVLAFKNEVENANFQLACGMLGDGWVSAKPSSQGGSKGGRPIFSKKCGFISPLRMHVYKPGVLAWPNRAHRAA